MPNNLEAKHKVEREHTWRKSNLTGLYDDLTLVPNGCAKKSFRARKWKNKIESIPKCLTPNANNEETFM